MKKIRIPIVLCIIVITLVSSGFAWASPLKSLPEIPIPAVSVQLQNLETGENLAVPVTYKVQPDGDGRYVAIYKSYEPGLMPPLSYTYRGSGANATDVSSSVRIEIWVYFWGDDTISPAKMKIDYYKVKWQLLVSDTSLSNAKLTAYCWTQQCSEKTKTVTCSLPGSWCYNYPSWRNVIQNWDNMGANYGTGTITLKRGSSTWNFSHSIFVPNP